ncbi:MAG: c-type cytochrome biogenesis protein CcmI [Rhodobacteraceae bacterium]|nr:c-type cytochrome biogenesis protein CcmI [Paracoccaceae bacterium]
MIFWVVTGFLASAVAGLLVLALLRGRTGTTPAAAYDLQIYRDQLKELDRDLVRGVIDAADAGRVRTEVSRRILAADAQVRASAGDPVGSPALAGTLAVVAMIGLVGGSFALYLLLGAPGYGDLSLQHRKALAEKFRANRPGQAVIEARLPRSPPVPVSAQDQTLMNELRQVVANRPDDLQGQMLLAGYEARFGDFRAAHVAQARVLKLKGPKVEATDYADYADMLVLAAKGYVSPEAEAALERALTLDPANGAARYLWGLLQAQIGRPDRAFRIWEVLLHDSPPDATWVPQIRAQIEEIGRLAGVRFVLPEPLRGPAVDDMAATADLNPREGADMIRRMVTRFSDRLATEGRSPTDWARLASTLGVWGNVAQAQAMFNNAMQVFAMYPMAMALIRDAGARAGLRQ